MEVMLSQSAAIAERLTTDGRDQEITITPDLAEIPRFVSAVVGGNEHQN